MDIDWDDLEYELDRERRDREQDAFAADRLEMEMESADLQEGGWRPTCPCLPILLLTTFTKERTKVSCRSCGNEAYCLTPEEQ